MQTKKNYKVCIFLNHLDLGGVGRVMVNLSEGLIKKGIDVDIFISKSDGAYISDLNNNINLTIGPYDSLKSNFPSFIKYLKNAKPDMVLSATPEVNILALTAKKLLNLRTKFTISIHTHTSHNNFTFRQKLNKQLSKLLYKSADYIVAVSNGVANDLQRLFNLKNKEVNVIYNPVNIDEINDRAYKYIDHLWFKEEQKVVVGVGRLTEAKDFLILIRAFSLVLKQIDARLIILGEGEERSSLENLVKQLELSEYVDLPGYVQNPFAYMSKASVFVLSSKWEGFGNVLVEALAAGCQVVSTDCESGPNEILKGGKYGKLVPVGDENKLAEAIVKTLKKSTEENLSINRADSFSVPKITSQYLQLWGIE